MRATPTVVLAASAFTWFQNGGAYTSSAATAPAILTGNLPIDFTATATAGHSGAVSTNSVITLSAEL
jgi:hypothetical protein